MCICLNHTVKTKQCFIYTFNTFLLLNKPNVGLPETLNPLFHSDVKITLTFYVMLR